MTDIDNKAQSAIELYKQTLQATVEIVVNGVDPQNKGAGKNLADLINQAITTSSYITWAYLVGDRKQEQTND